MTVSNYAVIREMEPEELQEEYKRLSGKENKSVYEIGMMTACEVAYKEITGKNIKN